MSNVKEIVGLEQKKGTFENEAGQTVAFDNVYLHLLSENPKVAGRAVSCLKVKSALADGLLVGDFITLNYDTRKDGTPYLCSIEVVENE